MPITVTQGMQEAGVMGKGRPKGAGSECAEAV